jgi:adenosylhomocysteine nucleosidase
LSAASDPRPVVAVTGLAFESRIAAGPGVRTLAGGGDGPRLAADLEREFAHGVAAIISFGIAGGLDVAAVPGTWLVVENVIAGMERRPVDAAWAAALMRRLPGARSGDLVGADAVVATPEEKRALRTATGAFAVDTESHVVAAFAAARGIPFVVFRVIADPATRALSKAAASGMRADGTVNRRAVLGSVLRSPRQLPALVRNANDTRIAVRELSRGRRLLGPGLGYPDLGQFLVDVP